jgi:DNA polymerase III subunit gamma/tau
LCLMAPDLVQLPGDAAEALTAQSQRLGAAPLVAAIERLGEILVELRHSPDPRVLIEVTLVQLCRPRESGDDLTGLAARVAKLERAAAAPPAPPAPVDPATGRAKLGGRAEQPPDAAAATVAPREPDPVSVPAPAAAGGGRDEDLAALWTGTVRPNLRGLTRALFAPVEAVSAVGDVVTLSAPNATHQAKCEQQVGAVERALGEATGRTITVRWASGTAVDPMPPAQPPPAANAVDDDHHEPDESQPVLSGGPSVLERVSEAFPGARLVGEDD